MQIGSIEHRCALYCDQSGDTVALCHECAVHSLGYAVFRPCYLAGVEASAVGIGPREVRPSTLCKTFGE